MLFPLELPLIGSDAGTTTTSAGGCQAPLASTSPAAAALTPAQRSAVERALDPAAPVTLVHGPPGTGKTVTAAAIVQAWLDAGARSGACGGAFLIVDRASGGLWHIIVYIKVHIIALRVFCSRQVPRACSARRSRALRWRTSLARSRGRVCRTRASGPRTTRCARRTASCSPRAQAAATRRWRRASPACGRRQWEAKRSYFVSALSAAAN